MSIKKINFKKIKKYFNHINAFLCFMFIFTSILFPSQSYGVKLLSFGFILLLNFNTVFNIFNLKKYKFFTLFIIIFIPINICISILNVGMISDIISQLLFPLLLLLLLIFEDDNFDIKKYVIISLKVMSAFITICYLFDILNILDIYDNKLLMWFHNSDNAMIGKGSHTAFYYMLFLKTSPLLFYLLFESFKKKDLLFSVLAFISILASGTRANVMTLVAFVCIYLFFKQNKISKIIVISSASIFLLIFGTNILEFTIDIFMNKASSDAVRSGHLTSILSTFNDNPMSLIFGQGIGTTFYSTGVNKIIVTCELSYWNILRQFGIIGLSFILFLFGVNLINLIKNKKYECILFVLIFLIISYTNPFLWSTTGIIVLLISNFESKI